ncbi:MAG: threonine synthase [Limnochordales bacterium]|nr:threonine synthase [Limnochordales bacterium]
MSEYISTRGNTEAVGALTAIRRGIAPDGGLYLPESLPSLSLARILALAPLSYQERAQTLLSLFLSELEKAELRAMVDLAYGPQWDTPRIAPIRAFDKLAFLELWHGPTCAFKDLALQLLPHLLTAAAARAGSSAEIVILVATSGDTGKAALAGFADIPGTRIIVFYPKEGVSSVQERQMVTQTGGNVHVVAVQGNFDDAQAGVKAIFTDERLLAALSRANKEFSSANSINWGRLVPQIVYYFSGYLDMVAQGLVAAGDSINVVVPSGNFGNILAAHYARRMGLPIARLICASNRNRVLTDFLRTGVYDRNRPFYRTSSPSMDILVSSNVERLLFELADRDSSQVRAWQESLARTGRYELSPGQRERLQAEFWGGFADEEATRAAIARTYRELGYVVDPHTAVAVHVFREYVHTTGDRRPTLIASTASPFKFSRVVLEAIWEGETFPEDELELLPVLSDRLQLEIPAGLADLARRPVLHDMVCAPAEMKQVVAGLLGLTQS